MRIISHRKLKEFYETPGREDSKVALERWYQIAEEAEWRNFSDIRTDFPDADYVGNQHYVFNIRGNRYRLVVVIKFTIGRLFVRFVGTHSTKEQYEFALNRIEDLLPLVTDDTPANDKNAIELTLMSDIVESYEKKHFPIGKPSVSELIELSLNEKKMTQKQLASEIGVSPSRINDYVTGRSEPTLKIARLLCKVLNITPAAMLQC